MGEKTIMPSGLKQPEAGVIPTGGEVIAANVGQGRNDANRKQDLFIRKQDLITSRTPNRFNRTQSLYTEHGTGL